MTSDDRVIHIHFSCLLVFINSIDMIWYKNSNFSIIWLPLSKVLNLCLHYKYLLGAVSFLFESFFYQHVQVMEVAIAMICLRNLLLFSANLGCTDGKNSISLPRILIWFLDNYCWMNGRNISIRYSPSSLHLIGKHTILLDKIII